MVAAVRGQAARGAKAPSRAPAGRGQNAAPRRKPAPAPTSKFRGAPAGILSPRIAVMAAGGAVAIAVAIALFSGNRLESMGAAMGRGLAIELGDAGFRLSSLKIVGASPMAAADIARISGLTKDQPIASVDLGLLREKIKTAGWVEDVTVSRLWPTTIVVKVKQRTPVAVWQSNGVMRVVDATGRVIPEAAPGAFPDLPLLVGAGANTTESSVLSLIKARPRLAQRLDALVRVDERRWDLRLKDGAIIQLPAVGEEEALIQLDKLDAAQRLLELGFERIDLRSSDMVVVRRRDGAPVLASPSTPVPAGVL
jgi:cell division protein FtsQ